MDNTTSKTAWNTLFAQICAKRVTFSSTGTRTGLSNARAFDVCGEGYEPSENARVTRAGRSYLNGLYSTTSPLGASPQEVLVEGWKRRG